MLNFQNGFEILLHLVFWSTILRLILPPKELVWQYYPGAKWYGLFVDVVARWGALDVRTKIWDVKKHSETLRENNEQRRSL